MLAITMAQIHHSFFAKSASFIYQIINNLKYFRLLFIVREFQNLGQFSLLPVDYYSLTTEREIWHWFEQGIDCRFMETFHDSKNEIPRLKSFYDSLISKHYGKGK